MRMLAAESRGLSALASPAFPHRDSNWLLGLGKSVRIPRVAVATFAVVLAVVTIGWIHSTAENRTVTRFICEISGPGFSGGNPLEIGQPDVETAFSGNEGYAWKIEVLRIADKEVTLRLQIKHFTQQLDLDTIRKELGKITAQQIDYLPGRQLTIPVDGGGTVKLRGTVVREEELAEFKSKPAASLLPDRDEINIQTPVLIRDGKELLASTSAGTRFRCEKDSQCSFFIYIPRQGLFVFSANSLAGGIQGKAFMGEIGFQEEGHLYTVLAPTPITGGEQPRDISILHIKNYLPSQHNRPKSEDELVGLGQGTSGAEIVPAH